MACALAPPDKGDPLAAARRLGSAGSLTAAMICYGSVLITNPDALVHYERAAVAHQLGDTQQVERDLRASLGLAPWFGDGYFELGNTLYGSARRAESVSAYRAALRQRQLGDRPMVLNNLGNVLADSGDHKNAISEFRRGLRLAPAFPYLYNGLANALSASGRGDAAVTAIRQALQVQPTAHYAAFNLGNYLRELKRAPEAEHSYRFALSTDPAEPRYHTGLGQLLHEPKWEAPRLLEAEACYRTSMQLLKSTGAARSAALERDLAAVLRDGRRWVRSDH